MFFGIGIKRFNKRLGICAIVSLLKNNINNNNNNNNNTIFLFRKV